MKCSRSPDGITLLGLLRTLTMSPFQGSNLRMRKTSAMNASGSTM